MSPNKKTKVVSYQQGAGLERSTSERSTAEEEAQLVQNEYVLNVAFWTFLIFTIAEAFFAVIAGSQSMLEDAEAMSVDALTYLFNLWAERVKHRPYSEKEMNMSPALRDLHRERLRLYMELIPPLISVVTLILVTVFALKDAFESLNSPEDSEDDVDISLMMIFSILNMLLDFVNVTCFARAHQAFGLSEMAKEHHSIRDVHSSLELEGLIQRNEQDSNDTLKNSEDSEEGDSLNLNMCSAWTVSIHLSKTSTQRWIQ